MQFSYDGYEYTVDVAPNSYYPSLESMFTVYVGVSNKSDRNAYPSQVFSARKVTRHGYYDSNSNLNDIALVVLNKEASLNQDVQIACLPNPMVSIYPNQSNIFSWIVGWGDLYGNKTYPDLLQNAKITVYNSSQCSRVFPTITKVMHSNLFFCKVCY